MFTLHMNDKKNEVQYKCPNCAVAHTRILTRNSSILYLCSYCKCILPNLNDLFEYGERNRGTAVLKREAIIEYHCEKYEDFHSG